MINWGYSSAGRAVALQAKGHRFDPVYLHHFNAGVAQLVEHYLAKVDVVGSNPITRSKQCIPSVMAAYRSPKPLVGVRVPGGTPNICTRGREAQCN